MKAPQVPTISFSEMAARVLMRVVGGHSTVRDRRRRAVGTWGEAGIKSVVAVGHGGGHCGTLRWWVAKSNPPYARSRMRRGGSGLRWWAEAHPTRSPSARKNLRPEAAITLPAKIGPGTSSGEGQQRLASEPVARIVMRVSPRNNGNHRKAPHQDAGYGAVRARRRRAVGTLGEAGIKSVVAVGHGG